MSFLPIVNRELLTAAKRKSTYQLRAVVAFISLLFIAYLLFFTEFGNFSSDRFGRNILTLLSSFSFAYCLMAGVFFTSDCIATERREGTIGLLFLTKLKAYDVTAGKLAAHSLTSVYGLVATFPLLALSMLFGGVTDDMFIRTALALTTCLLLSLSVGLLASAALDSPKQSMTASALIIGLFAFAPPLLERFVFWAFNSVALHPLLLLISPFTLLKTAWSTPTILPFWTALATILGIASFFFILATGLTSSWRKTIPSHSMLPPSTATRARTHIGVGAQPRSQRQNDRRLSPSSTTQHPFNWVTSNFGQDNHMLWALLLIATVPFLWMFFKGEPMWLAIGFYSLFPLHILLKSLVTADACRRIHTDKRSGFLELLCVTPQPQHLVPSAYHESLRQQYRRPAQLLCTLNLAAIIGFVFLSFGQAPLDGETLLLLTLILGGGTLLLFIDLQALIWLGLREGLIQDKPNRATFKTIGRVMAYSWIAVLLLVGYVMGGVQQSDTAVLVFLWQLASVSWALHLARKSRRDLQTHFQAFVASTGPSPGPISPKIVPSSHKMTPVQASPQ